MMMITRTMRQPLLLLLTVLVVVTTTSVHGTAIHPKHRRRHLAGDNKNNNNNNNNMSPKEKDVIANPICSTEALTAADISGNDFISRAEYVNLLLDLAPPDCPIIDMWLNQDALKQTFEKLSCLCHEFGGIDGENNCCLQAVSVPMLAAFATPNSYYPQEYSAQACAMIDQVLVQHCPKTVAPTPAPTKTESPTTLQPTDPPKGKPNDTTTNTDTTYDIGLTVTTFETAVPSMAPSMAPSMPPTPDETLELTQAGELVEVVIEDGQVTTTTVGEDEEDNNLDSKPTEVPEEEDVPEEEAFIQDDDEDEAAGSNDNSDNDNDNEDTSELPDPSSPTLEETEEPPVDGSDLLEGVLDGSDSSNHKEPEDAKESDWTLQQQGEQQQQQQEGASGKETPVGILLSALLVITFLIALALLAIWGKRRGLMENPWKRPTEMTVNTASSDDIETPRRSNTRRSQSFDDDDEDDDDDSQSDEDGALTDDDEDGEDGDEETGNGRRGKSSKSVVRAEFQDDLSVWGRRKRRRQERKQRREERQRQSLEQNPPQHQNTITTILSTLEFDLSGGGGGILANNGGGGSGASIRPNSTKSMGSMRSSMGGSVHTAATNAAAKENMVDIFDDKSDTSSYDGSPEHLDGAMPLETSIEDWLDHVQQQGKSRINADGSIVHDDRSVMSHISTTSKKSTTSSRRSNSMSPDKKPPRQPRDPSLQDWHTQRQQLNAASSSIPRLDYNKFSQPAGVAPYNLNSTRSYSPARSAQRSSISSSASYSPSQSPKPTYLLTSVSFSPASSPKSLRPFAGSASRSEPASPVEKVLVLQQETTLSLASSSSSASRKDQDESKDSDSPLVALKSVSVTPSSGDWNPLQLDLPVEHTHHSHSSSPSTSSTIPPPPRLSPESQEFYETVLRMEPPDEDDERHRGNAFAFEAVRPRNTPAPERYLV